MGLGGGGVIPDLQGGEGEGNMVDHSRTITPPSQMLGWGSHQEGDSIFQADISRLPPVSPDRLYFTDKFQRFITVSWTCTQAGFMDNNVYQSCFHGHIPARFTDTHPCYFHGRASDPFSRTQPCCFKRQKSFLFIQNNIRAVFTAEHPFGLDVEHKCCFRGAHVS
jgi:hypothetical protein